MAFVPLSSQPVFNRGDLVEGARLYAFDAGTVNPRPLYLDKGQDPTRIHPTPVVAADANWPLMWVGVGDYDVKITDANDAQIRFIAGLPGDAAPTSGGTVLDPLRQIQTGTVIRFYGTGRRNGYVRANGGTMGSGASDATERANDDCHDLFVYLYQVDPNLVVTGGRDPAGAEADWQAGKTITLPNYVDRFEVGAGSLYGLGATGGEATHALTQSELAAHGHTGSVTIGAGGGHTPSGIIGGVGDHQHSVNYNVQSAYGAGAQGAQITTGQATANQTGTTQPGGAHSHPFTGNAVPDHSHPAGLSIDLTGSGTPHENRPPYIADTAYLKL